MEEIFREETGEEVLEEFRKRIVSKDNYIPTYFDKIFSTCSNDFYDLLNFLNGNNIITKVIFKKDFIKNNKFNEDNFKQVFKENFEDDKITDEEISNRLKYFYAVNTAMTQIRKNENGKLIKNIVYNCMTTKLEFASMFFHELGHSLEELFKYKIITGNKKIDYFLKNYLYETTTVSFSYFTLYLRLLQSIQDKEVLNKAQNYIKKCCAVQIIDAGYFAIPIIDSNINKITIENYVDKNNKINFLKLYDFCFQKVKEKATIYKNNLIIATEADEQYIDCHFQLSILEVLKIKRNNELEEDLYQHFNFLNNIIKNNDIICLNVSLHFFNNKQRIKIIKDIEKTIDFIKNRNSYKSIEKAICDFNQQLTYNK